VNPFELVPTGIEGCFEIRPRIFEDQRGKFVKLFHREHFEELGLQATYEEEYYSVSSSRVLRGLHFQVPPKAHVKLVTCLKGSILDVVYDLRSDCKSSNRVFALELSADKGNMLYVPEGLAHGFYVLSDSATFLSMNSRKFDPGCDRGIRWDSIPYQWPDKNPVVSEKDSNMVALGDFINPF